MKVYKILFVLFLLFLTASSVAAQCVPATMAAGTLDTCFGTGGKVMTDITAERDFSRAVAIQADGKVVVAGISGYSLTAGNADFLVVRYNTDGTLDTTFDGDGIVVTDFSAWTVNDDDYCRGLAIQPDGKIIVGGRSFTTSPGSYSLAVIRYNTDGSLDTTFDGDGKAQFEMNAIIETYAFALQPDGKILVGGRSLSFTTGLFTGLLARFNSNGSIDTSFGSSGSTTASIGGIFSIALQTDGKIVAAGTNGPDASASFAVSRLNSNGSLDTSFGTAGVVTHHPTFTDFTWSVKIRPDNKIFVSGHSSATQGDARGTLLRFGSDGTLEQSVIHSSENAFWNMAFQPDAKLLTIGLSINPPSGYTIRRWTDVNVPDTTFNGGATYVKFLPAATAETSSVNAIAMTADKKIITAGSVTEQGNLTGWRLAIARLYSGLEKRVRFDFDGDSKSDLSIFRPSVGEWWVLKSSDGGNFAAQFGASSDKIVPADFTGDGKTDIAFWRPSSGEWFVLRSEDFSYYSLPFGISDDLPAPADYDADGKADPAVFRPSSATWYIRRSSDDGATIQQFGLTGDKPVAADYDGDGRADIAVFRPSNGQWWLNRSTAGVRAYTFGNGPTDHAVPGGDFTGDGKADVAIFRGNEQRWYILRSDDQSYYSFPFGVSTDIPAPGDYDGDGKTDAAVFRPSNATWFVNKSTGGTLIQQFGISSDIPVPNAFVP